MPTPFSEADAIRAELDALRTAGTLAEVGGDLAARYERAATLVDALRVGMTAAIASKQFTSVGLAERVRTLSEPLLVEAERLDRDASAIEQGLSADSDAAWAALQRPPASADERAEFADLQGRLQREDPAIAHAFLREAARTGGTNDRLLRAALTAPVPPMDLDAATWRPLVNAELQRELRPIVAERVSPQGPRAWHAAALRGLAAHLRSAVTNQQ
jgi:hypothetical protein